MPSSSPTSPARTRHVALVALCALIALRVALSVYMASTHDLAGVHGDGRTDYYPRAVFLARNGHLPTADELTPAAYLRGPGYAVLLAPMVAVLGDHPGRVGVAAATLNGLAEGACLLLLFVALCGRVTGPAHRLGLALLLGGQPWTATYSHLVLPATLNMLLATVATVTLCQWAATPDDARGPRRLVLGSLCIGLTCLLRAEMVAFAALHLGLACLVILHRRGRGWREGALSVACVTACLALLAGYSAHVRGHWNFWRADRLLAGSTRGDIQWQRTWCAPQGVKAAIVYGWARGEVTPVETLPPAAFGSSAEREQVRALLARIQRAGRMTAAHHAELNALAEERVRARWWHCRVVVPTYNVAMMWWDAPPFPKYARLTRRLRVGGVDLLAWGLRLLIGLGIVAATLGWRRHGPWLLIPLAIMAARTAVFWVLVAYPHARYMLPAYPLALLVASLGLVDLLGGRGRG